MNWNKVIIRNCTFAFKCQANWDNLMETDDDVVRFCNECQREVHFCDDDDELITSIRLNRCVAIYKDDGDFKEMAVGMPADPFVNKKIK